MDANFWDVHGLLFLVGAALLPRVTLLLFTAVPFGWLAWLGWLFAPHLTVAVLATYFYWDTNPVLCIISWFFALGGTGGEAKTVQRVTVRRKDKHRWLERVR